MKKLKYTGIIILPIAVYISFVSKGFLTFIPVILFFGLVPLLELMFTPDAENADENQHKLMKADRFYDWLVYLVMPVQVAFLVFFLIIIGDPSLSTLEYIGKITSMGMMCAVFGINIGHELGHRHNRLEQLVGEVLLLTSLENHFLPYHNSGHHHNVATPLDPATARRGESIYLFWFRSHFGSYFQAWNIEARRLKKKGKHWLSPFNNRMIVYTVIQVIVLTSIYWFFGSQVLLAFFMAATMGILQLETVNYIEHYGLLRKQNEDGNYERVRHEHSWNSDHIIGRVLLFELSRHSDHHYKASKKYQSLDSLSSSPQMPTGYPGMMIFSLFTPLWIWFMNKKLKDLSTIKQSS